MRTVRRSVSDSMVSSNSATSSGGQSTSRWRRLEIDALMDANGVRRSWDTACSSESRSVLAAARSSALAASALQSVALGRGGHLRGERVEHPQVVCRGRFAVEGQCDTVTELPAPCRSGRIGDGGARRRASRRHSTSVASQQCDAAQAERRCAARRACRATRPAGPARRPARPASPPRPVPAPHGGGCARCGPRARRRCRRRRSTR